MKNNDFTPKKIIFFPILGGRAPGAPPWIRPWLRQIYIVKALKLVLKCVSHLVIINLKSAPVFIYLITVKPAILYGSEIWGNFNTNKLKSDESFYKFYNDFHMEKLNVKCCKFVLGL